MQDRGNLANIIKHDGNKRHVLDAFPPSELWRFSMEITRQNEGPEAFHRGRHSEPGYMEGMKNSYAFMLQNIERPLSADMLATIHDICVKSISDSHIEKHKQSFRDNVPAQYSVELLERDQKRGYFSRQGFIELFEKLKQHEKTSDGRDRFILWVNPPNRAKGIIDPAKENPEELYNKLLREGYEAQFVSAMEPAKYIKQKAQQYIDKFYHDISKTHNDDEKLDLIIKLVKDIEQLHPFPDANGRTILIVLNKLLIENGFSPVMLDNPNRIDGMGSPYSRSDELKKEVLKGMRNYRDYCIDDLRKLIKNISVVDINNGNAINIIRDKISTNPLTAMSQINALFLEIKDSKLSIKSEGFSLFRKNNVEVGMILDALKSLYLEKVHQSLSLNNSYADSGDIYKEIISRHQIINANPQLKIDAHALIEKAFSQNMVIK